MSAEDGLFVVDAEFRGTCSLCEESIDLDEQIVKLPFDADWVHAQCAEDEGHDVDWHRDGGL